MSGIFYNYEHLSIEEKHNLCAEAKDKSTNWWVDEKPESSWSRIKIEMTFDDIMKKLDNKCHYTVIHRQYPDEYGEIGFCTMGENPEYFLWIYMELDDFYKLLRKFHIFKKL